MRRKVAQCSRSCSCCFVVIVVGVLIFLQKLPQKLKEDLSPTVAHSTTPTTGVNPFKSSRHAKSNISNHYRSESSKNLETTIECIGSLYNQSCLYRNMYYVDQTFMILTIKGRSLPVYSVRTNAFDYGSMVPSKREFNSYHDLEQFVRYTIDPGVFSHVTLYFGQYWHYNIGHALFDGLYPAYLALIRFAPRHLQPFRILASLDECDNCWSEGIYGRFAGLGLLKQTDLDAMSRGRWFVFDELIMGSGTLCQRCIQSNFQLPGGVDLNGSKLFRDRMYQQHGLSLPVVHQYQTQDPLNAYVIHNKRFTIQDQNEIRMALKELNDETHRWLSEQNQNEQKSNKTPLIRAYYIYYDKIQGHASELLARSAEDITPLQDNQFVAHLRKLKKMHIHLSGPGTGQMYQTFLADGSVNINLGGIRPAEFTYAKGAYSSFLEQYMTSGTPYIKGLYYPINERAKGIKKDQVIQLIRQAATLIQNRFAIPVHPRDNLAPDGQLFLDLCQIDEKFCSMVTTRSENTHLLCLDLWIEDLVHEYGQWSIEGVLDNGRKVVCPYNRSLMRDLRKKYGIDHQTIQQRKP